MRESARPLVAAALLALACSPGNGPETARQQPWSLADAAVEMVTDADLEGRIYDALDAAATAGTDPSISGYHVRAGTVVHDHGIAMTLVGGNSEYAGYPEAIHGETSLMNHVINQIGPQRAREEVEFLAFYTDDTCGGGGSCGDCRDYLMTTTRWEELLMVCGQASDHTVHVRKFADWVVPESDFPKVEAAATGLTKEVLGDLVTAALDARSGGVSLFTGTAEHLGVALLSHEGRIYSAAGTDDAAFHYRYPVGAALQQAATHRDYFVRAILVAGEPGGLPRLSYRDRQYGYEASSFNLHRRLPPIDLILIEWSQDEGSSPSDIAYRRTTFEAALPGAFSAASFMPEAVDRFLEERAGPEAVGERDDEHSRP